MKTIRLFFDRLLFFLHTQVIDRKGTNAFNTINFVLYGIMYDTMLNLYKPFAVKFIQRIGGTEFHISLYNSLPGLFAAVTILPGVLYIRKKKDKKQITSVFFACSRTILLTFVFVNFLPPSMKPMAFVLCLAVMNFFDAISQSSLQSFLGDLFSPGERAKAISLRNKLGNISVCTITLLSGLFLTIPKTDNQKIIVYQIFFFASFLFGIGEVFVFCRFRERKRNNSIECAQTFTPFAIMLKEIMSNHIFLKFSFFTLFFYFSYHLAWPLFNIVLIQKLNASELWIAISAIANVIPMILSSKWWGKKIQKYSTDYVMSFAAVGLGLYCLMVIFAPSMLFYSLFCVFGGFVTVGINNCLLTGLLENTPDRERVIYIGFYNTCMNASLAIAPLAALYVYRNTSLSAALFLAAFLRIFAGILIYIFLFKYRHKIT